MSDINKKQFWNRTTFLIITGASQGIGRNLAIEFSRHLSPKSTVLLLARSEKNLNETKELIVSKSPEINVNVHALDLTCADASTFHSILDPYKKSDHELSFLVHNAASVIVDVPASKISDKETWDRYMSLNLYSVTALTRTFLELFTSGEQCILNISSLAAIKPFKGMAYYCVGKAAREMYFRTLSAENPSLNILNYAPGPINTAMFSEVADKCCDADTRMHTQEMKEKGTTVKMEDTIQKIISILEKQNYQPGDRIDYFDEV